MPIEIAQLPYLVSGAGSVYDGFNKPSQVGATTVHPAGFTTHDTSTSTLSHSGLRRNVQDTTLPALYTMLPMVSSQSCYEFGPPNRVHGAAKRPRSPEGVRADLGCRPTKVPRRVPGMPWPWPLDAFEDGTSFGEPGVYAIPNISSYSRSLQVQTPKKWTSLYEHPPRICPGASSIGKVKPLNRTADSVLAIPPIIRTRSERRQTAQLTPKWQAPSIPTGTVTRASASTPGSFHTPLSHPRFHYQVDSSLSSRSTGWTGKRQRHPTSDSTSETASPPKRLRTSNASDAAADFQLLDALLCLDSECCTNSSPYICASSLRYCVAFRRGKFIFDIAWDHHRYTTGKIPKFNEDKADDVEQPDDPMATAFQRAMSSEMQRNGTAKSFADTLRPDTDDDALATSTNNILGKDLQRSTSPGATSSTTKSTSDQPKPLFPEFQRRFARTHRRFAAHFPTFFTALPRLPFGLIPFAFSQFILIEALERQGWIDIFSRWLVIASQGKIHPVVWLVGVFGVILCNISGTNIGATILLTKIVRASNFDPATDRAAAVALAVASNIGAVSFTFSASLAGLLWVAILKDKGIVFKQWRFAMWNSLPLLVMTGAGLGVVSAMMAVLY
ncbi:hypothetical protein NMY22_g15438 [Coprinellus aureogranulatus]|nr:hypothetical protein NMY22_g15438 [Coprinellus aureogranulatus]